MDKLDELRDKHHLAEVTTEELLHLADLLTSPVWDLLKKELYEPWREGLQSHLESSNEIETILRAQGGLRTYREFVEKLENIVRDMKYLESGGEI